MTEQYMRLAFPTSDRETVDEHFGHAREFAFVDMEGDKIVATDYVTAPDHAPGVIPNFVADNAADVILTGGMGEMAVQLFRQRNVDVILGVSGSIAEAASRFANGELDSTGSACDHHH